MRSTAEISYDQKSILIESCEAGFVSQELIIMNFLGIQFTLRQLQIAIELNMCNLPLSHLDTVHSAVLGYFIGYSEILTIPCRLVRLE